MHKFIDHVAIFEKSNKVIIFNLIEGDVFETEVMEREEVVEPEEEVVEPEEDQLRERGIFYLFYFNLIY